MPIAAGAFLLRGDDGLTHVVAEQAFPVRYRSPAVALCGVQVELTRPYMVSRLREPEASCETCRAEERS